MASSYSDLLRLELQADGENENTWGQIANAQFELLEAAIAGRVPITLAGSNITLSTISGAADQARGAMLDLAGTLSANVQVIIPAKSKWYIVHNGTSGAFTVTVKTASGSGVEIAQDSIVMVACDGTDCDVVGGGGGGGGGDASTLGGIAPTTFARKDQGLPSNQIFTKAQGTARVALSAVGGSVAVDASLSNCFYLPMTGNFTLANPTNPYNGQTIRIVVKQDGTGSRLLAYGSKYKFPGGVAPALTTTASRVDYLAFEYFATDDVWLGNIMKDIR